MAIHACGSSTDLILDKCINNNADIIISPCCYGSIKNNDLIKYPRSKILNDLLAGFCNSENGEDCNNDNNSRPYDIYSQLANYADRTELNRNYEMNANICMQIIDTDRCLKLTETKIYSKIQLTRLQPLTCTTKNNLIFAKSFQK
jgi:hypothetical protein